MMAGGKCSVRVQLNSGLAPRLNGRLGAASAALCREAMRQMEPYMPKDTGEMIASMHRASAPQQGLIRVQTPYARAANTLRPGRAQSGVRGPAYFARMKADKLTELHNFAKKEAGAK